MWQTLELFGGVMLMRYTAAASHQRIFSAPPEPVDLDDEKAPKVFLVTFNCNVSVLKWMNFSGFTVFF